MRFEFATAPRIVFGEGTVKEAAALAGEHGDRALVVTGRDPERASAVIDSLKAHNIAPVQFTVAGEPTLQRISEGVVLARAERCQMVISFGGGSAIDAGKAIAASLTNPGDLLEYLEIIGRGRSLTVPSVPFIAIPTTAGTGAEATRNAVLASPEHRLKVSLRSALLLPRAAIVDPGLLIGLPRGIAVTTGIDALTQLIESFLSCRANPFTDALCREGIPRVARSLRRIATPEEDSATRSDMALASLFSGIALANAGLGAVHGFAGPIGGSFSAPHSAICAALLPHALRVNLSALRERANDSIALQRFDEVARLLTGDLSARAVDAVTWTEKIGVEILPLRHFGIGESDLRWLAEKASSSSSMKGNPIELTAEERVEILRGAL